MGFVAYERDICRFLAASIGSHELVVNPPIFDPIVLTGKQPSQILIKKIRLYGGKELSEPGLTLSIYPSYVDERERKVPAVSFKTTVIGERDEDGYMEEATARYTLELAYLDSSFDTAFNVPYRQLNQGEYWLSHGKQIEFTEETGIYSTALDNVVDNLSIEVSILPAEEILRGYMGLMRLVLRDLNQVKPIGNIRPRILDIRYPTAEIFEKESGNLLFHRAYMHLEITYFEHSYSLEPLIKELNIYNSEPSIKELDVNLNAHLNPFIY